MQIPQTNEEWPELDKCHEFFGRADIAEEPAGPATINYQEVFRSFISTIHELRARFQAVATLEMVRKEIAIVNNRLARLEARAPVCIPIQSLAPEPYEVVKPMNAIVQSVDDEYVATFFDANLASSGETQAEAVLNLKDVIAAAFDVLSRAPDSELGAGPLQQKRTLEEFVQRKR